MPDTIEGHSLLSTWNRLPQGRKLSPTICHGLIQTALEEEEAPEHLQYVDGIVVLEQSILFLTIMAYDRYAAICKPLHYGSLMGSRACGQMAAAAWGSGFLNAVLHTATTFSLPLCQGNAVDQFFCEIPQILKLSCSDAYLREVGALFFTLSLVFLCFLYIALSYVQILRAVLRMPSEQGRHKAFSTCLPHLAVVSLFVSTAMFAYLKPPSISSPSLDLVFAFLYSGASVDRDNSQSHGHKDLGPVGTYSLANVLGPLRTRVS
ncbi:olfactory receptor 14J1-like [Cygnus atratus]|uniref:olfactory receptor 14J1-like n=1 Tax=Cygnus atratus TaxID=8868 RepID=UPI0021B6F06C|nr:olfactory receptor 14J1-like [Cygnus atratus]